MAGGMEGGGVAQADLADAACGNGNFDCAVRVFPAAECGSIHRLLEIHALWAAAHRECAAGPAAAALCRPVWMEGNGAGGGGRVSQAAAGGAKVLRDFRAELRTGGRD